MTAPPGGAGGDPALRRQQQAGSASPAPAGPPGTPSTPPRASASSANGGNPAAAVPGAGQAGPATPPGGAQPGAAQPGGAQPGSGQQGGPDAGVATPPGPTGPDQAKQVDSAAQWWANPQADAQEEQARRREDKLSGRVVVDGGVRGDVVAGDKIVYMTVPGRGRSIKAYRLPVELCEQPHVPMGEAPALRTALERRRLVVVRGKPGTGKFAALVHALVRALAESETDADIIKLSDETDLSTLEPARLPKCGAIVLDDLTKRHVEQLTQHEVGRLCAELDGSDRWLGLTVADDVPLPSSLNAVVLDLTGAPSARAVFECHLYAGRLDRSACVEILRRLDRQLDDAELALGRAAGLARELAENDTVPDDLDDLARRWLDMHYDCVQWFRALGDLRAHGMALALAVFDGLPREEVTAAADRLVELVGARGRRTTDPFASDVGIALTTLRARAEPGTVFAVEGDVPVTVLRYVRPGYPRWVLEYAWAELDTARPHLVAWLRELGGHHNADVRTAAAVAVGVLARKAFDFVFAQIIGNWAASGNVELRESASLALGPPSRDPHLRSTVDNLVQGWIVDDDEPLQQATAARTFGSEAGRARFFRSMERLAKLAMVDHIEVAIAVAMSLGDMVLHGSLATNRRVLQTIEEWVGGRRQLRPVGQLAFLRLTYLRDEPAPVGGRLDGARDRTLRSIPTLLILVSQDPEIGARAVRLCADGLTAAGAQPRMRASLVLWAEATESHPAARAVLVELLRRVAAHSPRAAAVLRREPSLAALI